MSPPVPVAGAGLRAFFVKCTIFVIAILALAGCQFFRRFPAITSAGVTVQGPQDAGRPATLNTSQAGESVALPAGSRITVTQTEALPPILGTKDAKAVPAMPATTVTEIVPGGPTEWRKTESTVNADTGTVDTSIAARKIDAAESRPLLYAALTAAIGAGFFVWAKYPTPALACGAASAVFFMAWKVSGLPEWFWAVGLLAAGVGCALYLGHERGEKTAQNVDLK
jgi:hypothetical protein